MRLLYAVYMNLESIKLPFDSEKFAKDFRFVFEKYALASDNVENLSYDDASDIHEREVAKSDEEKRKRELVSLAANALKSAADKNEVLNIISQIFFEMNVQRSKGLEDDPVSSTYNELNVMKEVIIDLLKGK